MRNPLAVSAFLFCLAAPLTGRAADISVVVKNIASSQGTLYAQLCDKATFLRNCAYNVVAKAREGEVTLMFRNIPQGLFAVSVFHDENNNKEFDRDAIGIPTEGFGVSRDARGFRGPPKFEDAAVDVKKDNLTLSLTLNY